MGKKKKHQGEILSVSIPAVDGAASHHSRSANVSFAQFFSEAPISATLLVIGLITLVLAILDFAQALSY